MSIRYSPSPLLSYLISICLLAGAGLAFGDTAYVSDKLLIGVHTDKNVDSPIVKVFPTGTQFEVLKRDGDFAQVKGPEGVTGWVDASYLTDEQPAAAVVDILETQNRKLVDDLKTAEAKAADLEAKLAKQPSATAKPADKPNEQFEKLRKDNEELQRNLEAERGASKEYQNKLAALQKTKTGTVDETAAMSMLKHENQQLKQALEDASQQTATATGASPEQKETNALANSLLKPFTAPGIGISFSPKTLLILLVIMLAASFGVGVYLMDYVQRKRHGGFRL